MTLPNYQIFVLDPWTGAVRGFFDGPGVLDLKYSRLLSQVGVLALTLPGSGDNYDLFTLDSFVEVYRTDPVSKDLVLEGTYLSRLRQRYRAENEQRVVVGAVSLEHLLQRRIVRPEDDPLVAGGYSTKQGYADTVIAHYVLEQAGIDASVDRQIPGFQVMAPVGSGELVGARLRYENLYDSIYDLSRRGEIDFRVTRGSGANLVFYAGKIGQDRTRTTNYGTAPWVGLDPRRGNLTSPSLVEDRKTEKNFIFALSQGQGETRTVLEVPGSGIGDSPFNRIEYSEDVRNLERDDALGQLTAARASLNENSPRLEFTFEPTGREPGNVYRQNWDLGDDVSIIWENVEKDVRIVGVEVTIDESGEALKITVENLL